MISGASRGLKIRVLLIADYWGLKRSGKFKAVPSAASEARRQKLCSIQSVYEDWWRLSTPFTKSKVTLLDTHYETRDTLRATRFVMTTQACEPLADDDLDAEADEVGADGGGWVGLERETLAADGFVEAEFEIVGAGRRGWFSGEIVGVGNVFAGNPSSRRASAADGYAVLLRDDTGIGAGQVDEDVI